MDDFLRQCVFAALYVLEVEPEPPPPICLYSDGILGDIDVLFSVVIIEMPVRSLLNRNVEFIAGRVYD